jgi:hypothetical protein
MSFITTLEKDVEKVVSAVESFFAKIHLAKNWQTTFTASVQALGGTVEGIVEITGNEAQAAKIQSAVQLVNVDFATLTGLVASYNSLAHSTFVQQVTASADAIQANIGSILALIDVKNTNLVNEVTGVTTIVTSGLGALLALIPAVSAAA